MRPRSHWSSVPIAASPGLNKPSPRIVTTLRSTLSSTFTRPRWISSARKVASRGAAAGLGDPVAPLEAEFEADIQELEQVEVGLGVLGQPREELEELLAAADLSVEQRQETLLGPGARGAQRRARRRLVDQRAERVASR